MGGTEAGGIVLAAAAAGAAAAAPAPGGTLDSGGGPVMDAGALLLGASAAVAAALFFGRRWFRLAAAPRPAPLAPPLLAGAGLVAMLLAGPVGALAAEMLLRIERHEDPASAPVADHARLLAGAFAAQALAAAAIVALGRGARRHPPPAGGPPRPGLVRAALLGAGGLFLFWPAVAFCSHVAEQLVELVTGEPHGRIAHETLARLADAPADAALLAMAALVVLGAPVLEEITYRGLLQRTLADLGGGRWPAIALTSAAFAAVHHDVARIDAIGGLFLLSLGLGWVYERSGRLIGPIVMHSLFNAGNLLAARAM